MSGSKPFKRFIRGLKRVKLTDCLTAWKIVPAAIVAPFFRYAHPDFWIICEDKSEARDNGYWLFKYLSEKHPEQECAYAIENDSVDYQKVATLGKTVEYGSLKHWVYYLASSKKISSQKSGNPNPALFYLLEVYGFLKDCRCFLQHGITVSDAEWLYSQNTKFEKFFCGAKPEFDYVKDRFGYPLGAVEYTGFCRFDNLHSASSDSRQIVIMPSWREWIADEDQRLLQIEGTTDISQTNYVKMWSALLSDDRFEYLAKKYGVSFVFFPHRNMQKYISCFMESTPYLEVATAKEWDIQELLKSSALMITDYSSVFFDFAYMKKPVIFYQFDYQQFREFQYPEGWFDYRSGDLFECYDSADDVFLALERAIKNGMSVSESFLSIHKTIFPLYDQNNCERIYKAIKSL